MVLPLHSTGLVYTCAMAPKGRKRKLSFGSYWVSILFLRRALALTARSSPRVSYADEDDVDADGSEAGDNQGSSVPCFMDVTITFQYR